MPRSRSFLPHTLTLLALTTSTTAFAAPGNAHLARLLDAMASRGEIPVQDATRLETELRPVSAAPSKASIDRRMSWTVPLILARRYAHERGANVVQVPAPPSTGYVESATLPIRVYYQNEGQKNKAAIALEAAELSWNTQVVTHGYNAPFTDDEQGSPMQGLWLYLGSTGMGGGAYTEWLTDVPETAISDCSCRVVVDRDNVEEEIPEVVYHEFVHATQMATDCAEAISAWENFATAGEHKQYPESYYFPWGFLPEFQAYPDYPVDYWTQNENENGEPLMYYQYGAALFPVFLMEKYGNNDPAFLGTLWKAYAQEGKMKMNAWQPTCDTGNSPDWFEGTNAVLAPFGETFGSAFAEFSAWRAITGSASDGAHFKSGYDYETVRIDETHFGKSALPIVGTASMHEFGSHYLRFNPQGYAGPLRLHATGQAMLVTWSGSLLLWRAGQPVERVPVAFDGLEGEAIVSSLQGVNQVVVVLSQHEDMSHDPDEMDYSAVRSLDFTIDVPGELDAGADGSVSDGGADAGADAAADAKNSEAGADGTSSSPAEALEIGGGGCVCTTTQRDGSSAYAALAALALALAGSRRRSWVKGSRT